MGRLGRVVLWGLLLLGAARAAGYLIYAALNFPAEFETFNLEGKMALLADRVRAGSPLYPAWDDYPHVANFFGPLYFLTVGLVGRAVGSSFHGLFLIGRAVTLGSALATSLVIAEALRRRYGRGAAVAGLLFSLGVAPLYGFSIMVRPDLMAELLGLIGFLLTGSRSRLALAFGCVFLVAAILTKQTAAVFLIAAALALWLERKRARAAIVSAACLGALVITVAVGTLWLEPRMARDLFGEMKTPAESFTWFRTLVRALIWSPDLFYFTAVGVVLWARPKVRDVRLLALAGVVVPLTLLATAKRGADLNYYLNFRIIEAFAVGTLWHAVVSSSTTAVKRLSIAALFVVLPSTLTALQLAGSAWQTVANANTLENQVLARTSRELVQLAADPQLHLLSDAGLFDVAQRERAVFGDPWLFHLMVETGRIRPETLKHRVDAEYYDLVVTTRDLTRPEYAEYEFGLPMVLVERIREHYVLRQVQANLFIYVRRGDRKP
jgi:hypothetical protein